MSTKTKVLIIVLSLIVSFACGRYLAPTKVVTKTETVEVVKTIDNTKTEAERDKHKTTTTTETTRPDGTKTTTTTATEDTSVHKETSKSDTTESDKTSETSKEVTRSSDKVTISALAGVNLTSLASPPVYGASASRAILGPIAAGIFGLTNGTLGCSIGIQF